MENSELYRLVAGQDLASEDFDLDLLGVMPKKKGKKEKGTPWCALLKAAG